MTPARRSCVTAGVTANSYIVLKNGSGTEANGNCR
jgi:hypothetical protein